MTDHFPTKRLPPNDLLNAPACSDQGACSRLYNPGLLTPTTDIRPSAEHEGGRSATNSSLDKYNLSTGFSDAEGPSPEDLGGSDKDDSSAGCITVRTARLMTDFGYSDADLYEASDLDSDIIYDAGEWTEDEGGGYYEEEAEVESPAATEAPDLSAQACEAPPVVDDFSSVPDEFDYISPGPDPTRKRRSASFHHVCRKMDGFRSSKDGKLRSLKTQFEIRTTTALISPSEDGAVDGLARNIQKQ